MSAVSGRRLQLFRGVELAPDEERLDKEPRWSDLQAGVRIVWTTSGEPVRQIAPRSFLPVGRYNSRKAGRMLHHESRGYGHVGGEKLALMMCEIDPAVLDFRSQHIRFDLLIDGRLQAYFPDILTLMHDGSIAVIEVDKGGSRQPKPQYRAKLDIVRDICADLGWRFEIWSERTLAPTRRVRENIAQIQMQRFIVIDAVQILIVSRALRENDGRLAVGQIRSLLGCRPGAGDLVRGLMCRGLLELPLDERIDDKAIATLFTRCVSPSLEHAM